MGGRCQLLITQLKGSLSQMDADFKVLYILPRMNLLWHISLLIMLGSGSHYNISSLWALLAGSDLRGGKYMAQVYMSGLLKSKHLTQMHTM